MKTLYLVRHARPAVEGLCYGQLDVAVTVAHEEAAAEVHTKLVAMDAPLVTFASSPWSRAFGLASALAALSGGSPVVVDSRLSELSFGEWEGRTWDDLRRDDGARLDAWMESYATARPPGGETTEELDARVRAFVASMPSDDAIVVAHAGPIRSLRRYAMGTTWEEELARPVPYLGVERVVLDDASRESRVTRTSPRSRR